MDRRADYGIDAPPVVRNFLLVGAAGLLLVVAAATALPTVAPGLVAPARSLGLTGMLVGFACAATMVFASKVAKVRLRERWLDALDLAGDETVLDVGCGRGLLLTAAARRLPRGRAIGVDLWQTVDQSGNAPATTLANARAEGVEARVEIQTGDMRRLPLPDASVDAVVSSLAIHNVPDAAGRAQALAEIARVLRPGGKLFINDILFARRYADALAPLGFERVALSPPSFWFVIPSCTVTAVKRG